MALDFKDAKAKEKNVKGNMIEFIIWIIDKGKRT